MKTFFLKILAFVLIFYIPVQMQGQNFQGKATYISKSKMELGNWGAKMSEGQKKQIAARLKNRLEKTYILTFNKTESIYEEDESLEAPGQGRGRFG